MQYYKVLCTSHLSIFLPKNMTFCDADNITISTIPGMTAAVIIVNILLDAYTVDFNTSHRELRY